MNAENDSLSPADAGGEFSHAARKLEFDSLLELIAALARSERGRDDIRRMENLGTIDAVERSQREIGSVVAIRDAGEALPLDGWRDSRPDLERIRAEGAVARGEELARIAEAERVAGRVRA